MDRKAFEEAYSKASGLSQEEISDLWRGIAYYDPSRGPLTTAWKVWKAAQDQAEFVGWQFYENGRWYFGDDRIKDHRKNTEAAGYPIREIFAWK